MFISLKRSSVYLLSAVFILTVIYHLDLVRPSVRRFRSQGPIVYRPPPDLEDGKFVWANRVPHYPVQSYTSLPLPAMTRLPRVQHQFSPETRDAAEIRETRRNVVKHSLQRCWTSYREHAWMQDELKPISGEGQNTFGGWAATLVDTLDLLWIMDLKSEFREAVDAALEIDFSTTEADEINVFETTIRYLGGFLAAYDLSGDARLLAKTLELAEMLYAAFDTPNRMPLTRWDFHRAAAGEHQEAHDGVLLAEIGSLSIEFTRLAQITRDAKWYDAVARITDIFDAHQERTTLPGMWPLVVNARDADFATGTLFTLGAMSDSMYEYLPKMYALLGGNEQYARLYNVAMDAAVQHAVYRPMLPDDADVLMTGPVSAEQRGDSYLGPEGQHLVCFAGGMLALGGRLLNNASHVEIGRKLTDGCVWAYTHSELGIMPETYSTVACGGFATPLDECRWDETRWREAIRIRHQQDENPDDVDAIIRSHRLKPGFTSVPDTRYILRPEAIESVFLLYRITGDETLLDDAWAMFEAIRKYTETDLGNAALADVLDPEAPMQDSMESFWTAETLKYFYLIFCEPDVISLDQWVFNTEAHPVKRPA